MTSSPLAHPVGWDNFKENSLTRALFVWENENPAHQTLNKYNSPVKKILAALMMVIAMVHMACCGFAKEASRASTRLALQVNQSERTYSMYVPPSLVGEGKRPVVIAFHGGGMNSESMERLGGLNETADKHRFVVVYPDGSGRLKKVRTWNSGPHKSYAQEKGIDDVAFISALIDKLVQEDKIDPRRVFLTGVSNGGMMAYRLAAEIPEKIAAVASVAGTLNIEPGLLKHPMPVMHIHGTKDEFVPYQGGRGKKTSKGNSWASVDATIEAWKKANNIQTNPLRTLLPLKVEDGTLIEKYTYGVSGDSERLVLYKIIGGGHAWPGHVYKPRVLGVTSMNMDANEVIWEFFNRHPKL